MHNDKITIPSWRLQQAEDQKKVRIADEDIDKAELEKTILQKLRTNMNLNKGEWFDLHDLRSIKEVKEHFPATIVISERGIGKTYGLKEYLAKKHKDQETQFLWLRNMDKNIKDMWSKDILTWAGQNGWWPVKASYTMFRNEKASKKKDDPDGIIGWFDNITNFGTTRSITTPTVTSVVYDEFNSGKLPNDQFDLVSTGLNTTQRTPEQYKNLEFFLMSNYEDAANDILFQLGVAQEYNTKNPLLTIDWDRRTIVWMIPKGHYKSSHNYANTPLAKRWTIFSPTAYESQSGDQGSGKEMYNIQTANYVQDRVPAYAIEQDHLRSFNFYTIENGEKLWVCRNNFEFIMDVPRYTPSKQTKLKYINHTIVHEDHWARLFKGITEQKIMCSDITTLGLLRQMIKEHMKPPKEIKEEMVNEIH